jgi:hypothetical protein
LWVLRPSPGDFDKNHYLNAADIDLLFSAIAAGTNDPAFDLTADNAVNQNDLQHLLTNILSTRPGDANLDGHVDRQDFNTLVGNYGRTDTPSWRDGDFTGDDRVGLLDLVVLKNDFDSATAAPEAVVAARTRSSPVSASSNETPAARVTLTHVERNLAREQPPREPSPAQSRSVLRASRAGCVHERLMESDSSRLS